MKSIKGFYEFCRLCEKEAAADGRCAAAVNYRKTRMKLSGYAPEGTLCLSDITDDWVRAFNEWLVSQGHVKSSISFYNRTIRSIYNQAARRNLVRNTHPFDGAYTRTLVAHYQLKVEKDGEKTPLDSLTREELLGRYKSLAYKYNDILRRLKEVVRT